MLNAIIIVCVLAIILSVVSTVTAIYALIEIKAMQKSTHNIQYVPTETPDVTEDIRGDKMHEVTSKGTDLFGEDFDNVI